MYTGSRNKTSELIVNMKQCMVWSKQHCNRFGYFKTPSKLFEVAKTVKRTPQKPFSETHIKLVFFTVGGIHLHLFIVNV